MTISINSLMWLLPIVFMLHEFEEIIMGKAWMRHEADRLRGRLPAFALRILAPMQSLSTSAFSLAVAEEFVLLSGITWMCVAQGWFSLWAGMVLGFFIHLVLHVLQAAAYRRYIPAVITAIPAGGYCLFAVARLAEGTLLSGPETAGWTAFALVFLSLNQFFALRIALRFDAWLQRRFA
jgi:hypothetical protein